VFKIGEVQKNLFEWCKRNFPTSEGSEQFKGIVEELGELSEVDDRKYSDREETLKERRDAIGDIFVYLFCYSSFKNIFLQEIFEEIQITYNVNKFYNADKIGNIDFQDLQKKVSIYVKNETDGDIDRIRLNLWKWVGKISHIDLKEFQKIRGYDEEKSSIERKEAVREFILYLVSYSNFFDFYFATIINQVSSKILRRNWVKNNISGGEETKSNRG